MVLSLRMEWRHVLFANWPVDPTIVAPHIPDGMTLETFDGDAWLSAVPFTNVDVRPPWVPDGWGLALPELNLRTYVACDGVPGVYFFSLDAQGISSVIGARVAHRLPYYYARIGHERTTAGIRFESRRLHPGDRPLHFRARYEPIGDRFRADAGSLEAFLTERYRLYTEGQDGAVRYTEVEHEQWPLRDVRVDIEPDMLFAANGFDTPDREPVHLYSPSVQTVAARSKRL